MGDNIKTIERNVMDQDYQRSRETNKNTSPTSLRPLSQQLPGERFNLGDNKPRPLSVTSQGNVSKRRLSSLLRLSPIALSGVALLLVLIIGGIFLLFGLGNQTQQTVKTPAEIKKAYGTVQISLSDLRNESNSELIVSNSDQELAVNGKLRVNNSLILTPTGQPQTPSTGQIYYDKDTNQPLYFNGIRFVAFATEEDISRAIQNVSLGVLGRLNSVGNGLAIQGQTLENTGVLSFQGQTGAVTLNEGSGIGVNGTTITNTGVVSLQGQTGAVTLTGGEGIGVNGTSITNTGVTGIIGTANQVSASNSTGVVVLSLPQDIAPDSSPTFASISTDSLVARPSAAILTIGSSDKALELQGNSTTISQTSGGFTSTLGFVTPTSNRTINLPDENGTICLQASSSCGFLPAATPTFVQGGNSFGTLATLGTNDSNALAFETGGVEHVRINIAGNVGIGTSGPGYKLDVVGDVNTTTLYRVGGVPISSANLSNDANLAKLSGDQTFTGANSFTNASNSFVGSGAGLTALNADNITTGNLGMAQGGTGVNGTLAANGQLLIGNGSGYSLATLTAGTGITIDNSAGGIQINATGAGSCVTCANVSLSNLNNVAINTSLLTGGSNIDLGSGINPFRDLYLGGSTINNIRVTGTATSSRTIVLPDASGTVAVSASGNIALSTTGNISFTGQLPIASGGTNSIATPIAGGLAYGNGSSYAFTSFGVLGQVVTSGGSGAPSFQNLSDLLVAGSNIAITGTTAPYISVVASPTFTNLTATGSVSIQGSNSLSLGSNTNLGSIAFRDGATANTGTLQLAGVLSDNTTYTLPTGTGNQSLCTVESGNCAGSGSGITGSGSANRLAKFTADGQNIGDSNISDDGTSVVISTGATIQGSSGLTLGTTGVTGSLSFKNNINANTLTLQSGVSSGNLTFTLPTSDGIANDCLKTNGSGGWTFAACTGGPGGGVTSVNSQSGVLTIAGTANQINVVSGGGTITLSTPQDIATTSDVTFHTLNLSGTNASILTNASSGATANLIDLQVNGTSQFAIGPAGNVTANGTFNGQSLTVAGISSTGYVNAGGGSLQTAGIDRIDNAGNIANIGTISTSGLINGQKIDSSAVFSGTLAVTTLGVPDSSIALCRNGSNQIATCTANANNVTLQQAYDASMDPEIVVNNTNGGVTVRDANTPIAGNIFEVQNNVGSITYLGVDSNGIAVTGNSNITGQYQIGGSQISSTNLSNDANLAKLDGVQIFTGANLFNNAGNSFTGDGAGVTNLNASNISSGILDDMRLSSNVALHDAANLFQNTSDSTTAFQIQNAAGSVTVFNADTTNGRVGIGTATPGYPLDVAGDINTSGVYRVNGVAVCTASGCTAAGGSGNYIQNGTALQVANFNIQSAAAASTGGVIRGATSQTADLLQFQNSSGTVLSSFDSAGRWTGPGGSLSLAGASGINGLIVTSPTGIVDINLKNTAFNRNLRLDSAGYFQLIDPATGLSPFQISPSGSTAFRTNTNSTVGFQIQNSAGTSLFTANTTSNTIGVGVAPISNWRMYVQSTGNSGTLLVTGNAASTSYEVARIITGNATQIGLGVQGSSNQTANLLQLQNSSGTVLSKFDASGNLAIGTATLLAGFALDVNGSVNVGGDLRVASIIRSGSSSARIVFASGGSASGNITLDTTTSNGTTKDIINNLGTTGTFRVQSSGVDKLAIGLAGQLSLPTQGNTGGILIGADTNLYRSAADTLTSDDTFTAGGVLGTGVLIGLTTPPGWGGNPVQTVQFGANDISLYRSGGSALKTNASIYSEKSLFAAHGTASLTQIGGVGPGSTSGILFGNPQDTNLYRSSANTLKTDDSLIVGTIGTGGTNLLCYDASNKLATCSDAPGAGNYINNGTVLQTANYNIQSASAGSVGGVIQGAAGQTADLLQFKNSAATTGLAITSSNLLRFGADGLRVGEFGNIAADSLAAGKPYIGGQSTSLVVYAPTVHFRGVTKFLNDNNTYWESANSSIVPLAARGVSGQTADLFQVQGFGGTILSRFAANGNLAVSTTAIPTSVLTVGTNTTTAAGGIGFGTDTNLYRSAVGTVRTDGSLSVGASIAATNNVSASQLIGSANLRLGSNQSVVLSYVSPGIALFQANTAFAPTSQTQLGVRGVAAQTIDLLQFQDSAGTILTSFDAAGKLVFGPNGAQDTNLYRSAANTLATDDSFRASGLLASGNAQASQILMASNGGLPAIFFGQSSDTMLTRPAAGTLQLQGNGGATASQLVVKGITSQTADLFQVQNSAGTVLANFNNNGGLRIGSQYTGVYATSTGLGVYGNSQFQNSLHVGTNLYFGTNTDTSLYRSAANTLKTDDTFDAAAYLLGGANINTGGTLSNVAYLDQANTFTGLNTFQGGISAPSVGANSEAYGLGSTTADHSSLAVGSNAITSDDRSTALGHNASATQLATALGYNASAAGINNSVAIGANALASQESTALGSNASASSAQTVAVGRLSTASNARAIAVGYSTTASGAFSVVLGSEGAAASGSRAIAIGRTSTANFNDSIAIGAGAATTAANQLVIGGSLGPIQTAFIGNGVINAAPLGFTMQGTGSSTDGTAGAAVTVQGGAGTVGNSNGGNLELNGGAKAGTGTVGSLILQGTNGGNVGIGTAAPSSLLQLGSDAGTAASGIKFGSTGDSNLYRPAANRLKTDGRLDVVGQLVTNSKLLVGNGTSKASYFGDVGPTGEAGITLGVAADTNLYRSAADTLKTDDAFVSASTLQGSQLISTVATGTAPLTVASTTKVTNLNADLLDGLDSTAFATASGSGNYIQNGTTPQTADFNITGNGTVGGPFTVAGLLTGQGGADISGGILNLSSSGSNAINITPGGASDTGVVVRPSIDSARAFQIQDSGGTSNLFVASTVDDRIGIGTAAPSAKLHVVDGSGVVGRFSGRVAGGDAVNANEFATLGQVNSVASGTNFIQNGTSPQTADFNITGNGTIGGSLGVTGAVTASGILNANATGKTAISIADSGAQSSGITIGTTGSVNLFRASADELKTDDGFTVVGLLTGQGMIKSRGAAATSTAFGAYVGGDSTDRYVIKADGLMQWGDGTVSGTDTNLYRSAANTLKTDDTFVSASTLQGSQLISTVATGTAPLAVASTTKVTNLNTDLLDGLDSTAFAAASGSGNYIQNGTSPQTADFNITGNGTVSVLNVTSGSAAAINFTSTTGGFTFNSDTNLYRQGANTLKTDGTLYTGNHLVAQGGSVYIQNDMGKLLIGASSDTNLYRSAADTLKTDDSLEVATNLSVTGTTTLTGAVSSASNITLTGSANRLQREVNTDQVAMVGGTSKSQAAYFEAFGGSHATSPGDANIITKASGSFNVINSAIGAFAGNTLFSIDSTGAVLSKNSTDSATAFQIQKAGAGGTLLNADTSAMRLTVNGGADATLSGGGFLQVGASTGNNLVIDDNEILARNNGATANLNLQQDGGGLFIGFNTAANLNMNNGQFTISNSGAVLSKNSTDSATAFQVQKAGTGGALFTVDTAADDVKIAADADFRIGGAQMLYSTASSDLLIGNYNGGGIVYTQSDGFRYQNTTDYSVNFDINNNGQAYFKNRSDSATAFRILDDTSVALFTADTSNMRIGIGTSTPNSVLHVASGTTDILQGSVSGIRGGDATISAYGDSGSLIPNNGFEINDDATPTVADGWTTGTISGSPSYSVLTGGSGLMQGDNTQTITATTTSGGYIESQCFPISSGNTYEFWGKFQTTSGLTPSGLLMQVVGYGNKANCLSRTSGSPSGQINGPTSVGPVQVERGGQTLPNGGWVRAQVRWNTPSNNDTLKIDALRFVKDDGQTTPGSADYAEWITYTGTKPQPGEVLVAGDDAVTAKLSNQPYDPTLIGVVSTSPYQTGGSDDGHSIIIALAGRVPVKVSMENGPIAIGDYLTSSSTPGVAMKATQAGVIIGTALSAYNGTETSAEVTVQLRNGYAKPPSSQMQIQGSGSAIGNLNLTDWDSGQFPDYYFGDKTQTDLIVQEVEGSFPNLLSVGQDGSKTFNYAGLTILNTKAIAEVNSRVNDTEKRVTALEQATKQATPQGGDIFAELNVSGTSHLANLIVSSSAVFQGSLTVEGPITLNGDIAFSANTRGKNQTIVAATTSLAVTGKTYPDGDYSVLCTPNYNTTCFVTNKTATGFTLNFGTAAPADATADWIVIR